MSRNLAIVILLAAAMTAHAQSSVMVGTNGVLYYPSGFFEANDAYGGGHAPLSLQILSRDISEALIGVEIADALSDYLTLAALDIRYLRANLIQDAANIFVDSSTWQIGSGSDVQSALDSFDDYLADLPGSSSTTTITQTATNVAGSAVAIAHTPAAYGVASNSLEAHIAAIDAVLAYLLGAGGPTGPLYTNLVISGATSVVENGAAEYTATAQFSDGSTSNMSLLATWAVSPPVSGFTFATNVLQAGEVFWGDTNINILAAWSHNGHPRSANYSVTITDLNEPSVTGLLVVAPPVMIYPTNELCFAYLQWDDGDTTDVSSVAAWGSSDSALAYFSYLPSLGETNRLRAEYKGNGDYTVTVTAVSAGWTNSADVVLWDPDPYGNGGYVRHEIIGAAKIMQTGAYYYSTTVYFADKSFTWPSNYYPTTWSISNCPAGTAISTAGVLTVPAFVANVTGSVRSVVNVAHVDHTNVLAVQFIPDVSHIPTAINFYPTRSTTPWCNIYAELTYPTSNRVISGYSGTWRVLSSPYPDRFEPFPDFVRFYIGDPPAMLWGVLDGMALQYTYDATIRVSYTDPSGVTLTRTGIFEWRVPFDE